MKRRFMLALLTCMLLSLLLAACGGGTEGASGGGDTGSKVLLYNNVREPTSLDPPIGFDQVSYDILNNAMEGMTRLGKDQSPEPAMASEWKVSDDGLKYTFTLRDGVQWSNGEPLKASDFEFAWKRMLDPKTASSAATLAYVFKGAEAFNSDKGTADDVQVKATDDKTLEVTLAQPAPWLLSMLANPAFFPVPQKTVESNPNWTAEADTFVSNGPFRISQWNHDSELKMVKNDKYWDAANVKLDGVTFKMINDSNTEYQLYQSGELHIAGVPADMSDQLFSEGKVNVQDSAGTYFYRFNTTMKPFDNAKIRKAFALAVDRQKIVDLVVKQKQKPAGGLVSYGLKEPDGRDFREVGGDLITFDAAQAKSLLAEGMKEAGYSTLPEVTLTYNTNDLHQKIAETLQAMFKDNLGVDVKLAGKEGKVLTAEQKQLQLQFSRSSWLPDFADPINFLDIFQSKSPNNRTGWSNAEYDKLIQSAYQETDDAKRFDLMHQAEKILMDEAPIMPMYFYDSAFLQSDKLVDVVRHPYGYMDFKWADLK
ncbi:peptide ABC transporter substrate-binding protein [Paenibacillus sp. XY044]|uniref:peptide ABC transporter substrate-binding protein n=1 Tax=Paenibacillus sp. XY044 TaxID=2026089 RepID=UPI000B9886F8|nr:peptide ABC transporter substrate-binding protein [Paenibacillus sp. XY044]OZB91419.1 oligopeptide ABC transporter substrate-binding protein [Paenibacillus sp. XY044]